MLLSEDEVVFTTFECWLPWARESQPNLSLQAHVSHGVLSDRSRRLLPRALELRMFPDSSLSVHALCTMYSFQVPEIPGVDDNSWDFTSLQSCKVCKQCGPAPVLHRKLGSGSSVGWGCLAHICHLVVELISQQEMALGCWTHATYESWQGLEV